MHHQEGYAYYMVLIQVVTDDQYYDETFSCKTGGLILFGLC